MDLGKVFGGKKARAHALTYSSRSMLEEFKKARVSGAEFF